MPSHADMHNVIELSHALVCGEFQKWVNLRIPEQNDTLQTYLDELEDTFYRVCTQEWGRNTLKRLFSVTLPAIIEEGGNWPSKESR
jgi:hypothetical protein